MKVTRFIALALALLTTTTFFACSDDDNKTDGNAQTTPSADENLAAQFDTPLIGDTEISPLLDLGDDMTTVVTDVSASGITLWDDGAAENLFDGNDSTTKLGGKELEFPVDITWKTEVSTTLKAYLVYSGNDSSDWPGRAATAWVLYGSNDGENWTEIDKVDDSGMEDVNATPYGYVVDQPAEYTSYKLSITATNGPVEDGGMEVQLNELVLIGDIAAE